MSDATLLTIVACAATACGTLLALWLAGAL